MASPPTHHLSPATPNATRPSTPIPDPLPSTPDPPGPSGRSALTLADSQLSAELLAQSLTAAAPRLLLRNFSIAKIKLLFDIHVANGGPNIPFALDTHRYAQPSWPAAQLNWQDILRLLRIQTFMQLQLLRVVHLHVWLHYSGKLDLLCILLTGPRIRDSSCLHHAGQQQVLQHNNLTSHFLCPLSSPPPHPRTPPHHPPRGVPASYRAPLSVAGVGASRMLFRPSVMLHGLLAHALAEALLSAPGMLGSLDLLFNPTGLLHSLSQAWGDLLLGPLAAIEARSPSQVLAATVCCCFQTMAVMLCLLSTSSAACGWIVPIKLYSCPFFYHLYTGLL